MGNAWNAFILGIGFRLGFNIIAAAVVMLKKAWFKPITGLNEEDNYIRVEAQLTAFMTTIAENRKEEQKHHQALEALKEWVLSQLELPRAEFVRLREILEDIKDFRLAAEHETKMYEEALKGLQSHVILKILVEEFQLIKRLTQNRTIKRLTQDRTINNGQKSFSNWKELSLALKNNKAAQVARSRKTLDEIERKYWWTSIRLVEFQETSKNLRLVTKTQDNAAEHACLQRQQQQFRKSQLFKSIQNLGFREQLNLVQSRIYEIKNARLTLKSVSVFIRETRVAVKEAALEAKCVEKRIETLKEGIAEFKQILVDEQNLEADLGWEASYWPANESWVPVRYSDETAGFPVISEKLDSGVLGASPHNGFFDASIRRVAFDTPSITDSDSESWIMEGF